jgi:hypothetical protein
MLNKFGPRVIGSPQIISKSNSSVGTSQYSFTYNTGFSIVLNVSTITGATSILSYQDTNSVNEIKCPTCNQQGLAIANNSKIQDNFNNFVNNSLNGNSLSNNVNLPLVNNSQSLKSSTGVGLNSPFANSIQSPFNFFVSVRQISINSSLLQLLSNFVLRNYFSTSLFLSSTNTKSQQFNSSNIKLIFFKPYSTTYYELLYLYLNDLSNNYTDHSLTFYNFVVAQSSSGLNML